MCRWESYPDRHPDWFTLPAEHTRIAAGCLAKLAALAAANIARGTSLPRKTQLTRGTLAMWPEEQTLTLGMVIGNADFGALECVLAAQQTRQMLH